MALQSFGATSASSLIFFGLVACVYNPGTKAGTVVPDTISVGANSAALNTNGDTDVTFAPLPALTAIPA